MPVLVSFFELPKKKHVTAVCNRKREYWIRCVEENRAALQIVQDDWNATEVEGAEEWSASVVGGAKQFAKGLVDGAHKYIHTCTYTHTYMLVLRK